MAEAPFRRLPLLDHIQQLTHHIDLSKTLIIAVQHLYETTHSLFNYLFENGLKRENLYVLGKCYSTDPRVLARLIEEGVKASPFSSQFDSYRPYDQEFDGYVEAFVRGALAELGESLFTFERVILLDDGGHLLEIAPRILPPLSTLVGIEQTSSGYNRLKAKGFTFPIINLSRSWLKLEYESPILAHLFRKKLFEKLPDPSRAHKLLIVGSGALGQFTHKLLKDFFDVHTYDLQRERSTIAPEELHALLPEFDVILGCTGTISFDEERLQHVKRAVVLGSLSSSDREFNAVQLRRQHARVIDCHEDVRVNGITLLNCGFPINFDRDYDEIDTDDFALTRALIFACISQAAEEDIGKRGFIEMSHALQEKLVQKL